MPERLFGHLSFAWCLDETWSLTHGEIPGIIIDHPSQSHKICLFALGHCDSGCNVKSGRERESHPPPQTSSVLGNKKGRLCISLWPSLKLRFNRPDHRGQRDSFQTESVLVVGKKVEIDLHSVSVHIVYCYYIWQRGTYPNIPSSSKDTAGELDKLDNLQEKFSHIHVVSFIRLNFDWGSIS